MSEAKTPSNRFFIGGNWKLNGTRESIKQLVEVYNQGGTIPSSVECVVSPTALHISYVMDNMRSDVKSPPKIFPPIRALVPTLEAHC